MRLQLLRGQLFGKGPLKMQVSFQACDEKTCLQPAKVTVELK